MSDLHKRKSADKKVDATPPPLIPASTFVAAPRTVASAPSSNEVIVVRHPDHDAASAVLPPATEEERKALALLQLKLEREAAAAAEATSAAEDGKGHGSDLSGDGGVIKKVLTPGNGPCPKPTVNNVAVSYSGRLATTGEEFDSDHGYPFVFPLGLGKVIKGWEVAIPTMQLGETSRLIIRSDYAYGDKGSAPGIPPHATLVFTVTIQDIRPSDASAVSQKQTDFLNDKERLALIKKEREEAAARRAALLAEKAQDKQKKANKLEELQAKLEAKKKGKTKPKKEKKEKEQDSEAEPHSPEHQPIAPKKTKKKDKQKEQEQDAEPEHTPENVEQSPKKTKKKEKVKDKEAPTDSEPQHEEEHSPKKVKKVKKAKAEKTSSPKAAPMSSPIEAL